MVLAIRLATTTQDRFSTSPKLAAIAGRAVATTVPSAAERKTGRIIGGTTSLNRLFGTCARGASGAGVDGSLDVSMIPRLRLVARCPVQHHGAAAARGRVLR